MVQKIDGQTQIKGGSIGSAELEDTAVTPAVYGDATNVPQITVDADGRITAATEIAISAAASLTVEEQDGAPTVANVNTIKVTNGTLTDNGSGVVSIATSAGISDGDKGDITVSNSGATWIIDNNVVTYAKMQDVSATDRVLGRDTAGAGDVEEITPAALRTMLNVADGATAYSDELAQDAVGGILSDTGDIDFTYDDATPAITGAVKNDAVTYAKLQNVSAAEKLLGRGAGGGAGDAQEINLGTNLSMSGTTLNAGGTAVDSDAIHDNVSGEIAAITEKTTLHNDDLFIIEDSEAGNAKKKVKKSNVGGGGGTPARLLFDDACESSTLPTGVTTSGSIAFDSALVARDLGGTNPSSYQVPAQTMDAPLIVEVWHEARADNSGFVIELLRSGASVCAISFQSDGNIVWYVGGSATTNTGAGREKDGNLYHSVIWLNPRNKRAGAHVDGTLPSTVEASYSGTLNSGDSIDVKLSLANTNHVMLYRIKVWRGAIVD